MRRAIVVAPGRGAYGASELGTLARYDEVPAAAAARDALAPDSVRGLDGAASFDPDRHLAGEHASPLIYTISAIDAAALAATDLRVVAVLGNSLGWYTALHVAGCLDFDAGLRLVRTMGALGGGEAGGGQIVWPLTGDDWRETPGRRAAVDGAIARARVEGAFAAWSVDLGGYAVIGGDAAGLAAVRAALPEIVSGGRTYPLALPHHAAFHTALVAERAVAAREALADLPIGRPRIPLVDGRGAPHRPLTASPTGLLDYTLGDQVTTTYDFAASLRVGLREYAPDAVVLLGPGESIGGAIGRAIVAEGWRGIRSRADFDAVQAGDEPVLVSLGRRGALAGLTGTRGRTS